MNILVQHNSWTKLKNLFRNFGLMILCYFLFFFILRLLDLFVVDIDIDKYRQTELFELLKQHPWKFAFMAVIVAPVLEEGLFRSLLKPSAASLKFFLCTILYVIGLLLIPEEAHWGLKYGLLSGILFLIYYALGEFIPSPMYKKLCYWLHRYYLWIWIVGAIIFGFVHIFNYVDTFQINLILIALIFPRIIAGFFFGKVKVENKALIWPILMHSLNNSMALIFILPFTLSQ
ncbi:type II CAAX prenyl endopeptidase Rce1 family protein [Christiangramia aquimixticola]|uniref:CPBP family glutamic-type intramembrane protease n=1 Tax=Christiangramia aquimixticola TaxID=1697558 RepID=UPI003AA8DA2B